MAEQALPTDILRDISAHWAGRALAYTCSALYASWRPEDYLILKKEAGDVDGEYSAGSIIVTSRMPNGAYHATSYVLQHSIAEIVEYDRGQLVSIAQVGGDEYQVVTVIINGLVCIWECHNLALAGGTVSVSAGKDNTRALYCVYNVMISDFTSEAQQLIKRHRLEGTETTLRLSRMWNAPLPHTYWQD